MGKSSPGRADRRPRGRVVRGVAPARAATGRLVLLRGSLSPQVGREADPYPDRRAPGSSEPPRHAGSASYGPRPDVAADSPGGGRLGLGHGRRGRERRLLRRRLDGLRRRGLRGRGRRGRLGCRGLLCGRGCGRRRGSCGRGRSRRRSGDRRSAHGKQRERVHVRLRLAGTNAEMHVRDAVLRIAGGAALGHRLTFGDVVPAAHEQRPEVGQRRPVAVRRRHGHREPVGRHLPCEGHLARGRRANAAPRRRARRRSRDAVRPRTDRPRPRTSGGRGRPRATSRRPPRRSRTGPTRSAPSSRVPAGLPVERTWLDRSRVASSLST